MQLFISFVLILLPTLLSSTHSYAQEDVVGWGKVKWSMTHSEVSKIYDLENWRKEYPHCRSKEKITIQGETFGVVFRFEEKSSTARLIGVSLPFSAENVTETHFDKICDSITSKYGPPSYPEKKEKDFMGSKRSISWVRKSGKIEYSSLYYYNQQKKKYILFGAIVYEANLDKDKL